jgi:hypothetical protein
MLRFLTNDAQGAEASRVVPSLTRNLQLGPSVPYGSFVSLKKDQVSGQILIGVRCEKTALQLLIPARGSDRIKTAKRISERHDALSD